MKKLIALIVLATALSACKDGPQDPAEIDLSGIQLEFPNLKLDEYKIPQDPAERHAFLFRGIGELEEVVKEDEEVDHITFDIYITPNKIHSK